MPLLNDAVAKSERNGRQAAWLSEWLYGNAGL